MLADLGVVDPEAATADLRAARVYAGHAGWGPAQLEAELERDDWIVEPACAADVFASAPEALWSDVLNRPSEATVGEAVPDLEPLVGPEAPIFVGGPVQPSAGIVLAEFDDPNQAGAIVFADVGVLGGAEHLDDVAAATRRARVFAGYAGWGPGQLEAELERSDWIVEAPTAEDVFCEDPQRLWSAALSRKGGHYALLARMPADPSLN